MNDRLKNLGGLFRNTRTRTIIVFTGVIIAFSIIVGIIRLGSKPLGPPATASVSGTPNIQSIPGGFDSPESAEYARLQQQQNVRQAQVAEKRGTAAIPTIISSSDFSGQQTNSTTCCLPCGCPGNGTGSILPLAQGSSLHPGTLIYDSKGRVIGTVGPDGKIRDANGNVIGTVGPDGLVRDANSNVIGGAATVSGGTPVYDAQGNLIGTVGPDGKVRDANGKVIGTVDPDGTVRNLNGNVIGKAGAEKGPVKNNVPGMPVYDAQGNLIGTVGSDGKVRDANGNIIGTVGSDGVVRDASGRVLGKTGKTYTGKPVYDAQGRLIGVVGPDGKVRDASGRVIGSVGLDGVVRDANGNVLGNTTQPGTVAAASPAASLASLGGTQGSAQTGLASIPSTQNAELDAIRQQQQAMISQQKADQLQQQLQGQMSAQASQLLAAWAPPTQTLVAGNPPASTGQQLTPEQAAAQAAAQAAGQAPAVKAGTIMFGILVTAVNSDQPGPVLAKIVEGKFKGGTLIGTLNSPSTPSPLYSGETVMLSFNTLTLPNVSKSLPVNIVAIDQDTARTGFSSYTNNHYLLRFGTLFASAFLQGYAQATSQAGSQVTSTGLATQTSYPNLSPSGKFMVALGQVGQTYSSQIGQYINTPPTVYVNSGTAMGLLFLQDVPPLPQ